MKNKAKKLIVGIQKAEEIHEANGALLRSMLTESRDLVITGNVVAEVWKDNGTHEVFPVRPLVNACYYANLSIGEAREFLKATGLVTHGRISQLLSEVFKGVKSGGGKTPDEIKLDRLLARMMKSGKKADVTKASRVVAKYFRIK